VKGLSLCTSFSSVWKHWAQLGAIADQVEMPERLSLDFPSMRPKD
jgi:hypothetical protein